MIRKDFEIKNDLTEIDILTAGILVLCRNNGIGEDFYYDIRLALEEAVSNTIKYGYEDEQVHMIRVRAGMENQEFFIEIEDDGKAFNPLDTPDPNLSLPVEEKPIGGLGIYLLRAVMDQVEYRRDGTRNILRMTKFNG
jgi:anti-sigma regulatory factor (Ser/Thr protein kinase)